MILSNGFSFSFLFFNFRMESYWSLLAVKYSFLALLKCVLIKLNLGYKVFILRWVAGWGAFQNVSSMKFSSVGNISLVLIINLNSTWNLKTGRILHWIVSGVPLASLLLVSDYSSSRGAPDFDYQMLKLSMKWYHSAQGWVFLGSVLCPLWHSSKFQFQD